MNQLAIARSRGGTIGDIPFLSTVASDVEASARASLYQQLADFQAIPQRINRVVQQLNAYTIAAPQRSVDESGTLATLQSGLSALQGAWSTTNGAVTGAIAAVSGGAGIGAAGDVAKALAGMTLASQGIGVLEQQARALVGSSAAISDAQRAAILAAGAPYALDLVTVAKWTVAGYIGWQLYKRFVR